MYAVALWVGVEGQKLYLAGDFLFTFADTFLLKDVPLSHKTHRNIRTDTIRRVNAAGMRCKQTYLREVSVTSASPQNRRDAVTASNRRFGSAATVRLPRTIGLPKFLAIATLLVG